MNRFWFGLGVCIFLIPVMFQKMTQKTQEAVIDTYASNVQILEAEEIQEIIEKAQSYNEQLYDGILGGKIEIYEELLNPFGNGMMGVIRIPKIDLKLPIYHGTKEEVLADGIGHLKGSSLPVEGQSVHCVLSGHRGLPSAELFTRLDEMKIGDEFILDVCGRELKYEVIEIQTVKPQNTEIIEIRESKELVSLVTCTPYGINTHRLVVTGEKKNNEGGEVD